jgi:hypothetical protein
MGALLPSGVVMTHRHLSVVSHLLHKPLGSALFWPTASERCASSEWRRVRLSENRTLGITGALTASLTRLYRFFLAPQGSLATGGEATRHCLAYGQQPVAPRNESSQQV